MDRSFRTALRGLAATAAVTATLGVGFVAGNASAGRGDPVAETDEMHGTGGAMRMSGDTTEEMDEMHARMSAGLSPQDRAVHDRMHEACSGRNDERNGS